MPKISSTSDDSRLVSLSKNNYLKIRYNIDRTRVRIGFATCRNATVAAIINNLSVRAFSLRAVFSTQWSVKLCVYFSLWRVNTRGWKLLGEITAKTHSDCLTSESKQHISWMNRVREKSNVIKVTWGDSRDFPTCWLNSSSRRLHLRHSRVAYR